MSIFKQKGIAMTEYVLITSLVVSFIFFAKIGDKTVSQLFHEAFSEKHNKYSQTISNLDSVDARKPKKGEK